ncbi:MAG: hypothetical protein J6K17_03610 [Oscillospiraceae bacterium]|nr:hypothetical protein [Oscillospiraceae bacterium]
MLDDIIELIIELVVTIFFDTYEFETGSKRFRIGWVIFLSIVMTICFAACLYLFMNPPLLQKDTWLYGVGAAVLFVMEIVLWYKYIKTK